RSELLPCPFCGESENLIVQHCEGTIIHPAYRIYCGNCGASSGYADRVDPAKYWNSRAALQSQAREDAFGRLIEALKSYMHFGCPVCSGDCHSANPPVRGCPVREAQEAIDSARRIEGERSARSMD